MNPLLSMDDVSLSSSGEARALPPLFEVERGECFGFLGPLGRGQDHHHQKLLTRQLVKDSGRIMLFGRAIEHATNSDYERIGILSDTSALLRAHDHRGRTCASTPKVRGVTGNNIPTLLDRMNLADDRKTLVKNCSKGMRQRAALMAALVHGPELCSSTSPRAASTPPRAPRCTRCCTSSTTTAPPCFLTTHDMAEAEDLCHRVGILNEGALVACDAPDALRLRFARGTRCSCAWRAAASCAPRRTPPARRPCGRRWPRARASRSHSVEPDLEEVFLELTEGSFRWKPRCARPGRCSARTSRTW